MEPKTRIAFVIYSLSAGGAERVASVLCNELISKYKITIITLVASKPFYEIHKDIEIVHCVDKFEAGRGLFHSLKNNYKLVKKLISIFRSKKIELVIGFMRTSNILSIIGAKFLGIPVIISERNHPSIIDKSQSKFWKILSKITYPTTTYLVVQTNTIKGFYQSLVSKNRLKVIPNPINPDFKVDLSSEKKNVILNVGSLIEQKAQHHLINAFIKLNPKEWSLYIVGEGRRRSELEELVTNANMNSRIKLLGHKANIETYYNSCKIFAFASDYEGFPNALLEAMHFGMACISTDCPSGPSDIITDKHDGFLVPVGDEQQLMIKINDLISNKERRQLFSKNAVISSSRFEIENVAGQWKELIDTALSS